MPDKYVKHPVIDINSIEQQIEGCMMDYLRRIVPDLNYNDIVKIKTTTFKDGFYYCYECLFRPQDKRQYQLKTNIDIGDIPLLSVIACKYLSLCSYYNKHLGLDGFCVLTGISHDTVNRWGESPTGLYFDLVKTIRDCNRNSFEESLQDTDLGRMALANNSQTIGLNYGYTAAVQKATATAPRLENIAERYGKPPQIGTNQTA